MSGSVHPSYWLPPSQENKNWTGGDPALYFSQVRRIWTDAWVCLHYWVVIWVACEAYFAEVCLRWLRGYIHSSYYYHHQIGSINLTHYHIILWLCAWDVCYIIFCHLLHIHFGKTRILFSILLCRSWWVQIFGYVLACRSCSSVCTLYHLIIIIVQTYLRTLNLWNACQIYFVGGVSKIKHISSAIHYIIYRDVCFQFTHFPCDDWENIHFVLLSSSSNWNNGMHCMYLYILIILSLLWDFLERLLN